MVTSVVVPQAQLSRRGRAAERTERAQRTDGIVAELRDSPATRDSAGVALTPEERAARVDELIEANLVVARTLAARYRNRGIDLEDLEQVACLALTKAAHRFDPNAGYDFLAYAVPTMRGELQRHFRDYGWTIRPPRPIQDMQRRITSAHGELMMKLGRSPRPSDVAAHLEVDLAQVEEALAVDGCFRPASLDWPAGEGSMSVGDLVGQDDRQLKAAEARVVLEPLLGQLCARDRRIVQLRFFDERTQQQIAEDIGLTQTQISRIITRVLDGPRSSLLDPEEGDPAEHPPAA